MNQYFVDVWQASLQLSAAELQQLGGLLADSERSKAGSFSSPLARVRFIAVRGLLRQTLAAYLSVDPASLQFATGEHGKPALIGGGLHFNLSHTGNALLIAIGNIADLGVDIEAIKPQRNLNGLAARCFSDREYQAWQQLSADAQIQAFYRLWTKKEAFVKAVGRGIALGVERCELGLEKGGQLLDIPEEYAPVTGWKTHELTVENGFAAALVTRNCAYNLRQLKLELN